MREYHYSVVIEKTEDGMYVASCPAFPGCHTQGGTYQEALENIKDAIELNIQARKDLNEVITIESVIEAVEISA